MLPLMLAKMCQICFLFLSARFRLDFCSLCAPLVLYSTRGRGVWFGTAFTTSLFDVFGAEVPSCTLCAREILILQQ